MGGNCTSANANCTTCTRVPPSPTRTAYNNYNNTHTITSQWLVCHQEHTTVPIFTWTPSPTSPTRACTSSWSERPFPACAHPSKLLNTIAPHSRQHRVLHRVPPRPTRPPGMPPTTCHRSNPHSDTTAHQPYARQNELLAKSVCFQLAPARPSCSTRWHTTRDNIE